MIIDELPSVSNLISTDELPVERGTLTYKTALSSIANAISSILGLGTAARAAIDTTLSVNGAVAGAKATGDAIAAAKVSYFQNQTVSAATSAQIMRIPASGTNSNITANSVVLECNFANPAAITSGVTWTSYAGYIVFTGTCTAATTANVVLGQKNN